MKAFRASSCIQAWRKISLSPAWPNTLPTSSISRFVSTMDTSNLPMGIACVSSHGRILNKNGVISWGSKRSDGYVVTRIGGSTKYVHRVVALAFLGPPPCESMNEINHIDGNPSNNLVHNLEYTTRADNVRHSYRSNPSRKTCAKALSKPVLGTCIDTDAWQLFPSVREAARQVVCSPSLIARCCQGLANSVGGFQFRYADCAPDEIPGEEWRPALHPFEGRPLSTWMVSSAGRVRSTRQQVSWGNRSGAGYRKIAVSYDGASRHFFVHRLVARAFHGPMPHFDHCVVHHKDGDPSNNRVDNLEYVTRGDNVWYSWHTGSPRKIRADSKPVWARHLTSDLWLWYPSMTDASRQLGLPSGSISQCCRGILKRAGEYEFILAAQSSLRPLPGEDWREIVC